MIRPFDLRDLALIRRLNDQVVTLHTEFALTNNRHPLRGAITSMLVGGQFPTYVWKAEERDAEGFVQLYLDEAGVHAHMVRTALQAEDAAAVDGLWLNLLDQLVVELGSRGVQSIIAEVNESGDELIWLRQAGVAVYTRQDIWISQQAGESNHADLFRPRQSLDDWDIQLLYAHTVPPMVQLVEPLPPLDRGESWVFREGHELAAFVHLHYGPTATWLRFFIHPNADTKIETIVAAALRLKRPHPDHPVYCCVRRYQSWLQNGLETNGFRFWNNQAVMVKHTVHRAQAVQTDLATLVKGKTVPNSSPLMQRYEQPTNSKS